MDRRYIHDNQVIERYLLGRLTSEEARAFEELYIGDPELLEELESAKALHEGLAELAVKGKLGERKPSAPRWTRVLQSPMYAAAASVALVAFLAIAGVQQLRIADLRSPEAGFNGILRLQAVSLDIMRGRDDGPATVAEVSVAADEPFIQFAVGAGSTLFDDYRATLLRADDPDAVVAATTGLTVSTADTVSMLIPTRQLTAGDYEIRLAGRNFDWEPNRDFEPVGTSRFTVVE